jgi:hypothetical protein
MTNRETNREKKPRRTAGPKCMGKYFRNANMKGRRTAAVHIGTRIMADLAVGTKCYLSTSA